MVFDYIDGAAGNETGAARNRAALDEMCLRPRVLRDVSRRALSVELFGETVSRPFGIAPMGMCNLAAPGADLMLARLAAREGVPLGVSTMASTPMERLIELAEGNAWFQLYCSGDGSGAFKLVERAKAAGYTTLVLTADVPELGRRPRELRHGFRMPFRIGPRQFLDFALHPRWSLSTLFRGRPELANFRAPGFTFDRTESRARADWDMLARLRDAWPGRLVVKGILDPADARMARERGVDAIQVSNHGARQLESAPAALEALAAIRAELGPGVPLFLDSGLRSGEDVLKALATGAGFTFLGRVFLFAIAAAGEEGLQRMWQVLCEELGIAMAQLGLTDLSAVGRAGWTARAPAA
ncbi:MAG: alpha-hydroxy-acid oxidizing protein [Alphaproteobacteria bacterium]|nr:MAG: alpha-hydroxy-acid oxidizing protein [Alphaproteobacteria bacterium]